MGSKSIYFIFSAVLFSLLLTPNAQAEALCSTLSCDPDHMTSKALTTQELNALPSDTKAQLQLKAQELAGIWGDTILEGDYFAEDAVHLDLVEELFRAGKLVGYHLTYSSKAWDTSTCSFDSSDLSTLGTCESGRIVESGYTSADFRSLERDPRAIATFQKD